MTYLLHAKKRTTLYLIVKIFSIILIIPSHIYSRYVFQRKFSTTFQAFHTVFTNYRYRVPLFTKLILLWLQILLPFRVLFQ